MKLSTELIATLNRGRGGLAINKKDVFLKLQKDADRKRLFCSNVSTFLSMIVVLRTSNWQLSDQQFQDINILLSFSFTTKFSSILKNYFQIFKMNALTTKCKIWKRKRQQTHLKQFQFSIFYKTACLLEIFHRWLLSIHWVFSADGHYRLIVSLCGQTLLHCVINLNQ